MLTKKQNSFKPCCQIITQICAQWIQICKKCMENLDSDEKIKEMEISEMVQTWNTSRGLFISDQKCMPKNLMLQNGLDSGSFSTCESLLSEYDKSLEETRIICESKTDIIKGIYLVCICLKDKTDEVLNLLDNFIRAKSKQKLLNLVLASMY